MSSSSSSRPRGGIREETLLRVPGAAVHLVAGSEGPLELGRGELSVVRIDPLSRVERSRVIELFKVTNGGATQNQGLGLEVEDG